MIYQLLKRHFSHFQSRSWAVFLTVVCVVFASLFLGDKGAAATSIFLPIYLGFLGGIGVHVSRNRFTLHDLTLPIASRDLFLAKAVKQAIYIWVPALIFVMNAWLFAPWKIKLFSLISLEMAAIFTAVYSLSLCYRIEYGQVVSKLPGLLAMESGLAFSVGVLFLRLLRNCAVWSAHLPFWLTLCLCGLITQLALCWGLAHLPASLQFGEIEKRDKIYNCGFSSVAWWPLARTIFDFNALITFVTVGLWVAGSNWMMALFGLSAATPG